MKGKRLKISFFNVILTRESCTDNIRVTTPMAVATSLLSSFFFNSQILLCIKLSIPSHRIPPPRYIYMPLT